MVCQGIKPGEDTDPTITDDKANQLVMSVELKEEKGDKDFYFILFYLFFNEWQLTRSNSMLSRWETSGLSRASKDPAVANDKNKSTRDQWENFI